MFGFSKIKTIILSLSIFCLFCFNGSKAVLTKEQKEHIQEMKARKADVLKQKDEILLKKGDILKQKDEILQKVKDSLDSVNKFNHTLITDISIDLPEEIAFYFTGNENFSIKLGLYNGDLIKIPLWGFDLYVSYKLQQVLANQYCDNIFEKIDTDLDGFIKLLEKTTPFLDPAYEKEKEDKKSDVNKEAELNSDDDENEENSDEEDAEEEDDEIFNTEKNKALAENNLSLGLKDSNNRIDHENQAQDTKVIDSLESGSDKELVPDNDEILIDSPIDAEKELLKYITNTQSLAYRQIVKNFFTKQMFFYLLYEEIAKSLKKSLLDIKDKDKDKVFDIFDYFKSSADPNDPEAFLKGYHFPQQTWFYAMNQKPIPLYNFITFFTDTSSRPMNHIKGFVEAALNFAVEPLKNYKTETGEFKRYKVFDVVDSYYTLLLKEFLIITATVKSLDKSTYKKRWFAHIRNNSDKLLAMLKEYKALKANSKASKKEDLVAIKEKIKFFIHEGHDLSFRIWLKNKNSTFSYYENISDLLLSIPTFYVVGKWTYEKYQAGEIDKIFNTVKNIAQTPQGKAFLGMSAFFAAMGMALYAINYSLSESLDY